MIRFLIIIGIIIVLYFLAIMPRVFRRPDCSAFGTRFFAHRGLHDNAGDAPENSMRAFERAVRAGFGIELDVQLSADGVPVIFHDHDLKRMCGRTEKVRNLTFSQLRELRLLNTDQQIPSLKEFLAMTGGRVTLLIELKEERHDVSVCREVMPLLADYHGCYCIESFNPAVLLWLRIHAPKVMRGQLSDGFLHLPEYRKLHIAWYLALVQNLLLNFVTRPDFIAYNLKFAANPSLRLCRRLYHARTAAWTVKNDAQLADAEKQFDVFIFDSFMPETGSPGAVMPETDRPESILPEPVRPGTDSRA